MSHTPSLTCSDCTPSHTDYLVELCPLHAAATEMRKALEHLLTHTANPDWQRAVNALAHAQGTG